MAVIRQRNQRKEPSTTSTNVAMDTKSAGRTAATVQRIQASHIVAFLTVLSLLALVSNLGLVEGKSGGGFSGSSFFGGGGSFFGGSSSFFSPSFFDSFGGFFASGFFGGFGFNNGGYRGFSAGGAVSGLVFIMVFGVGGLVCLCVVCAVCKRNQARRNNNAAGEVAFSSIQQAGSSQSSDGRILSPDGGVVSASNASAAAGANYSVNAPPTYQPPDYTNVPMLQHPFDADANIKQSMLIDPSGTIVTSMAVPGVEDRILQTNARVNGYFEMTILEVNPNVCIALGYATKPYPPFRLPGWEANSIALHCDNGHYFFNDNKDGVKYGPACTGAGNVIGCGYTLDTTGTQLTFYFTLNGNFLGNTVTTPLLNSETYAIVGTDGPCRLQFNFGTTGMPFRYAMSVGNPQYGAGVAQQGVVMMEATTTTTTYEGGYNPAQQYSPPPGYNPNAPQPGAYNPVPAPGAGGYNPVPAPGVGGYNPVPAPGAGAYNPVPAPGSGAYNPVPAPY